MAIKKGVLKKWMKQERITQAALAVMTDQKQSVVSRHVNGFKVSNEALGIYIRTKPITLIPDDVLDSLKNQHL